MTGQPATDELADLLARCALRDRRAFERLYQQTSAQLFGLIVRIVKDQALADEVLQEGYIKIWHNAADYRSDKARPLTWMGSIVRNQAIDLLRRASHRPQPTEQVEELHWLADDADGPQQQTAAAYRDQALHRCLDHLEGQQKQAVLMAYFQGLTHDELSQQLNAPLGTVKSWLRRGLIRLKQCLEQ